MSLSECTKCGGNIPLGPDASNVCERCGTGVFALPDSAENDRMTSRLVECEAEISRLRGLCLRAAESIPEGAEERFYVLLRITPID
jgi:hypothetical protein